MNGGTAIGLAIFLFWMLWAARVFCRFSEPPVYKLARLSKRLGYFLDVRINTSGTLAMFIEVSIVNNETERPWWSWSWSWGGGR